MFLSLKSISFACSRGEGCQRAVYVFCLWIRFCRHLFVKNPCNMAWRSKLTPNTMDQQLLRTGRIMGYTGLLFHTAILYFAVSILKYTPWCIMGLIPWKVCIRLQTNSPILSPLAQSAQHLWRRSHCMLWASRKPHILGVVSKEHVYLNCCRLQVSNGCPQAYTSTLSGVILRSMSRPSKADKICYAWLPLRSSPIPSPAWRAPYRNPQTSPICHHYQLSSDSGVSLSHCCLQVAFQALHWLQQPTAK